MFLCTRFESTLVGEQKLRLDYLWDRREALEKEGVSEADLLFYEILKRRIRRIREIVQYNRKTIPQRQDSFTRHELVVPVFSQGQRIKVAFDGRFSKIHTPKDKLVFVTRMSNVQRLPSEYFTWVPLKSNYRVTHADLKNEPIVLPLIDEQVQEDIYKKLKKSESPMIHSELFPENSEGQEEGTSLSTKLFDICNKLVSYILKADSSNESEPVLSYSTVCPETYLPQKATSSNEAESIFEESYIQKICSRLCNESDGAMPALDKLSLDSDDFEQMQNLGNVLRKWFCRKCYTYACGEHLPLEVPIPERIFSLSYEKDTTSVLCPPCGSSCFDSREISSRNSLCDHIWTNEDVYSFQSFWRVFGSNWCDFATIFFGRHTCYECAFFAESTNVARRKATRKNGQRKKNQSKRNPIVAVMNHIHCCHEGEECSSDNCSCKKSNLYCEKYCPCQILTQGNCARKAVYCTCRKGKCLNGQCPCFTEKRECDPDTCLCFANCRNPSKQKDNEFTCKNIGIRRKAHKRLVIAPSDTHKGGWGLFTLEPIEKFEFVCEYKGELVSFEELERREKSYERAQRTFLFSRKTGKVHIDATRKGGKSRFANEPEKSRPPNCFSQYMRTMGDLHVGIYAARNIQAGEEILFKYECGSEL